MSGKTDANGAAAVTFKDPAWTGVENFHLGDRSSRRTGYFYDYYADVLLQYRINTRAYMGNIQV